MMTEQEKIELRRQLEIDVKINPMKIVDFCMQLLERIEVLESRLNKNSSNSSKPPSSDVFNKPKPKSLRKKGNRKSGGQLGHLGKTIEQVETPDYIIEHKLYHCPLTGRKLTDKDIVGEIKRQVFDLPKPKLEITEHRIFLYNVPNTNKTVHAEFPEGVNAPVQYGGKFQSWLVYLSDYNLIPLNRIRKMCADMFGYAVSEGSIQKSRVTCFQNLTTFEDLLKQALIQEPILHADETGFRIDKKRNWFHTVSSNQYTYYGVHSKRGLKAIEDMGVLLDYQGRLIHDCWKPYFKLDCDHGLCNEHFIRELTFFEEEQHQDWAKKLKQLLWSANEDPSIKSKKGWISAYTRLINEGYNKNPFYPFPQKLGKRGRKAKPKIINLLDRLRDYKDYILAFIWDPLVPFTNNLAERDIRMVKVQQKISGSFRTWNGAKCFARIRSYISTAIKQNSSVFDALCLAMKNKPLFCTKI